MKDCLVIIDVQNGFLRQGNTMKIPQKILELLRKRQFEHIVCTKFINSEESPYVKLMGWRGLMDKESQMLAPEVKELSEKIFEKGSYTCFTPEFVSYFKEMKIEKLYFAGIDTDCCVLKSAADCFERNIPLEVLVNYCASNGGEESHNAAIKVMKRTIGEMNINYEL